MDQMNDLLSGETGTSTRGKVRPWNVIGSPAQLEAAVSAAVAVLGDRERMQSVIERAEQDLAGLRLELSRARGALDSAASQEDASRESLATARQAVRDLEDDVAIQEARIRGTRERLNATDQSLLDAYEAADAERRNFAASCASAFAPRYDAAVEAFSAVMREAAALASALDLSMDSLRKTILYRFLSQEKVSILDRFVMNGVSPSSEPTWKSDPKAKQFYDGPASVLRPLHAVRQEVEQIEDARKRERRKNAPEPGTVTITRERIADEEAFMKRVNRELTESVARQDRQGSY